MIRANGCGLAAPQIGRAIKLFIVDTRSTYESLSPEARASYFEKEDRGIAETFINAKILSYSQKEWNDYEGCLSIPGISKEVLRPWSIKIEYYTANFEKQEKNFGGYTARVIQHEYDHTNGILYTDRVDKMGKKQTAKKLKEIAKGKIEVPYAIKFAKTE